MPLLSVLHPSLVFLTQLSVFSSAEPQIHLFGNQRLMVFFFHFIDIYSKFSLLLLIFSEIIRITYPSDQTYMNRFNAILTQNIMCRYSEHT